MNGCPVAQPFTGRCDEVAVRIQTRIFDSTQVSIPLCGPPWFRVLRRSREPEVERAVLVARLEGRPMTSLFSARSSTVRLADRYLEYGKSGTPRISAENATESNPYCCCCCRCCWTLGLVPVLLLLLLLLLELKTGSRRLGAWRVSVALDVEWSDEGRVGRGCLDGRDVDDRGDLLFGLSTIHAAVRRDVCVAAPVATAMCVSADELPVSRIEGETSRWTG